jgi:lipoprotein-anchoring transpeptidase ErfK/SrfK
VSVALAGSVCLAGRPATAWVYGERFDPQFGPYPIFRQDFAPVAKARPKSDAKAEAKSEVKDFGPMPKGPLQIVVSIADQHVTLYSGGTRVAQGPVSTGVPGRPTPTGVFSIIQKDRFHHSNLYSNAPMPYMERITWSGVALHEGPLPGYPASHGCIRMSHDFAARLWVVARLGVRVVVAHNEVVPVEFSDPHLFEPKPKTAEPKIEPAADPGKAAESPARMSFAQAATSDAASVGASGKLPDGSAAAPAITPERLRGSAETARSAAPVSAAPASSAAADDPPKPPAVVDAPDNGAVPPAPPKAPAVSQPVKHPGAVAVFISRREKKLYVRQGFEPLFQTPIEIDHPEQPFGTHVFTALGLGEDGAHMRWNVMSIAAASSRPLLHAKIGAEGKGQAQAAPPVIYPPQTAAQVLDRIQIPQEAIDRISEILSPGSSLVISDQGLGEETGQGTDFIVLTR